MTWQKYFHRSKLSELSASIVCATNRQKSDYAHARIALCIRFAWGITLTERASVGSNRTMSR